jgi:PPOX class probable F420-dependent enzyme
MKEHIMLDPDVRRVLDGASFAHLATVLPDGSPHNTPVYVGAHGDRIVFFTGPGMRKARNLRRDPRLALSITPVDNPYNPVVIRGRVVEWIEGDAAWEIIDRLATKYTGSPYSREQERVVIVIEPERQTVGVG